MRKKYKNLIAEKEFEPSDFYRELAEYDLLDEFIKDRMPDKVVQNPQFKEKVIDTLVSHANEEVDDLDFVLLKKLSHSLEVFNQKVRLCKDQKP